MSLAASQSQSQGVRRANSLLATDSGTPGGVARLSGVARAGARRPGMEVLLEADEGAAEDVEMVDDEGVGAAHGVVGASEGWDSMPQAVKLPEGLFDSEEQGGSGPRVDVEMQEAGDGREGKDAGGGEEEERASHGDLNDSDSEPEDTVCVRRRRRK